MIVVYGNREYDDALLELSKLMTGKGFKVISAAAFIGEHSFSNRSFPIAENRPDDRDLVKASEYGSAFIPIIGRRFTGSIQSRDPG